VGGPLRELAGFRLEHELGRGGMGVVYLATELSLGRRVALKVLSPELAADERFRSRFLREARLAASLEHPHVVPLYRADEHGGVLYLVMRYVDGESLRALLQREAPLPTRQALEVLAQLAAALDVAHARGLVHRDVKPANVLVQDGHAYLCDFGLARSAAEADLTQASEVLGTLAYLAPEQIEGARVDGSADQYALACLGFELLSGRPPFEAESQAALLYAHLRRTPPPLGEERPELASLDAAFARALAKRPDERFASCAEFVGALERTLAAPPGPGRPAGGAPAPAAGPVTQGSPRPNLPVTPTPFLGRERELADVTALLSRDDVRLLTLTGPGGTGKTRLAAQAAAQLVERYPAGVWWVQLATLRDRELVLETAATAVGASDDLAEHIADRTMLLVFDNFEQVVGAAPEVAGVLASCPNLSVLVTSREPLRVSGEHEYAVPPLAHDEAVELFVARATAVKADFDADEAVPEICRRLDELPLALELAAARVKALSPRQILARLEQRLPLLTGGARDLPERQRTLRAAIAWSYELLTGDEQRLFARLAVFSGGCTLEAAEEVAAADVDALQSLVDKSLLRHTDERFWMLETIREFAAGELGGSGEGDELRRRHAGYFLELAEAAEPHLRDWWSSGGAEWLDRLEREHANFRAALNHLEAAGDGELALRLVGSISEAWELRGHLAEARRRLESALAADERPTHARAKALNQAATIAVSAGDAAAGRRLAEEALHLHRTLADAWGTANSTFVLGYALAEESDMTRAQGLFEEAARRFDEARDEHYALLARRALAWACYELGDLDRTRRLHEENLERARALPNDFIVASTLSALAGMAVDDGRIDDAVPLLEESQRLYRELGDPVDVAVNLCRFAKALAAARKAVPAAELLATYEALCGELGAGVPWAARSNEETLSAIRGLLDEAALEEAWERGRALDAEQAVALALGELRPDDADAPGQ
jgi:predicted ATPase/predicted Ser/Thr protein kinase